MKMTRTMDLEETDIKTKIKKTANNNKDTNKTSKIINKNYKGETKIKGNNKEDNQ